MPGPHYLLIAGTFLHVFGLMMTSISKTYYQILLSQAVCSATGASLVFSPAFSSVCPVFPMLATSANRVVVFRYRHGF